MRLTSADYLCGGGGLCRGVEFKLSASAPVSGSHTITLKGRAAGLDRFQTININVRTQKVKFREE
jgi:hypothetical protein